MALEDQVTTIYAGTNGFLDEIPVDKVPAFLTALQEYLNVKDTRFITNVKESKKIEPASEDILKEAIAKIKQEQNLS